VTARALQGGRAAALVGAGIFLSRIAGLVRQRVLAHYLGLSDAADALSAAFRIPNLLQNLFGEGVLSASFIPVYARLLGEGKEEDANRVAGAVGGLLAAAVSAIVLAGVAASGVVVDLLAPGFEGAKRDLTVALVRVLFPGTGLLVLSAWCLGILNSHHRFFLSYAAPVAWNVAIIAAAIAGAVRDGGEQVAIWVAWGAVAGSLLQVLVQVPTVLGLARGLRFSLAARDPGVRRVARAFGPAVMGRGVTQISAYVDGVIVSLLGTGAQAGLANAQLLYTLPVSLFGMSVSASELPAMAKEQGDEADRHHALRRRLEGGLLRIAFFVVPCAVAFLALGGIVAGAIFQTGRFTAADSRYVWAILAGSSLGLLAATFGRLTASAFFALGDTRTPLRAASARVAVAALAGWLAATRLPAAVGVDTAWGAAFLSTVSGLAAWLEYFVLRRALAARIGPVRLGTGHLARLWGAALVAAAAAWPVQSLVAGSHPAAQATAVFGLFALVYGAATWVMGVPEARALLARFDRDA
jgi:putative peptidoglycan lipid II flippase